MIDLKYAFILICSLLVPLSVKADINISVIAPTDGDFKYYGEELVNGAKVAVDEINENGGLLGKKVNLIQIEDPCDETLSLTTAQMIAVNRAEERKIHMVVGPICNHNASKIAEIFADAQIFQIHPIGTSQDLFKKKYPSLFELVGYIEQQAVDLFRFYNDNYKGKKLVVLYDGKNTEMSAVAKKIQHLFTKDGNGIYLKVVDTASYEDNARRMAKAVENHKADVLFVMEKADVTRKVVRLCKDEKPELEVFINHYWSGYKFAKKIGKAAEGVYVLSLPSLKDNPNFAENLVKLRLWGIEPDGLMAYGYLSVKTWQKVAEYAKTFDAKIMAEKINKQVLPIGWGNVMFENGVPERSLKYAIYHIENGEYAHVY